MRHVELELVFFAHTALNYGPHELVTTGRKVDGLSRQSEEKCAKICCDEWLSFSKGRSLDENLFDGGVDQV